MEAKFVDLTLSELEDVNGGAGAVGKFLIDYAAGKAIDFVIDHADEIWENFKKGPQPGDPMLSTPYVQIFGGK